MNQKELFRLAVVLSAIQTAVGMLFVWFILDWGRECIGVLIMMALLGWSLGGTRWDMVKMMGEAELEQARLQRIINQLNSKKG
jgi:divalent metal cation (Fe/Co/Zn/Cd) transporter